ncbi:pilus assembly protein CpaF [Rhodovulum bhavnagarense]|uniref:Pilus assembly protein CpaF n=1 Tax=Rhodovulum bhavnagarense TaxID=992286 RepID=A0A4R2RMD6_9RHOB|nr:CpaF family protein [Rhodovulum bhavnagarense]TCP60911.1 pilus assembly protein CpaF [Rhodovulum bhavnagarense]
MRLGKDRRTRDRNGRVSSSGNNTERDDPASGREDRALEALRLKVHVALLERMDATDLIVMNREQARARLSDEIALIARHVAPRIGPQELAELKDELCADMLGFGPIEPFLSSDDISDIMVNGTNPIYVERHGKLEQTDVRFRDDEQLLNVCQKIVSLVGRHVDEASPICDARLKDGSRVNIILPPLSMDGPSLTIRRFARDRFTIPQMVDLGTISAEGAEILSVIGRSRCNILVSGGTGSGKTTLLNALTGCIEPTERIVTCEDTAELQLQQDHVVRLETRVPNIEGQGEVTMRQLVRNCLRMRPDRIILGEVRGPEAFDLLQAMNTGHDGSMGTLHANSPIEAVSRLSSMVKMGFSGLDSETIEQMFGASVDVIIHIARFRDGVRRITHITDVLGISEGSLVLQDVLVFDFDEDPATGEIRGYHRARAALRPSFYRKAAYFGEDERLMRAIGAAVGKGPT